MTFAWLCDVFVAAEVRGRGIGVVLVNGVMDVFEPLNLKRMLLATEDAQGLYAKFGFEPLATPSRWMERQRNKQPVQGQLNGAIPPAAVPSR